MCNESCTILIFWLNFSYNYMYFYTNNRNIDLILNHLLKYRSLMVAWPSDAFSVRIHFLCFMVLVALRSKIVHWSRSNLVFILSLGYQIRLCFIHPFSKNKILLFFQTWSNDVNENQKWQIVFVLFPNCMPCQMENVVMYIERFWLP